MDPKMLEMLEDAYKTGFSDVDAEFEEEGEGSFAVICENAWKEYATAKGWLKEGTKGIKVALDDMRGHAFVVNVTEEEWKKLAVSAGCEPDVTEIDGSNVEGEEAEKLRDTLFDRKREEFHCYEDSGADRVIWLP